MTVPRLHVVTDDEVLAAPWFRSRARDLLERHGPRIALHLRGPRTPAAQLLTLTESIAPATRDSGGVLLVNDRADVALAAAVDGVHAAQRSIPLAALRTLAPDWLIGASVHSVEEALAAAGAVGAATAAGADFLLVGTVWRSASHPGREGASPELVRQAAAAVDVPVIAIGGVTPERAAAACAAGAAGVAVLSGVWREEAPARAAGKYLEGMTSRAGVE